MFPHQRIIHHKKKFQRIRERLSFLSETNCPEDVDYDSGMLSSTSYWLPWDKEEALGGMDAQSVYRTLDEYMDSRDGRDVQSAHQSPPVGESRKQGYANRGMSAQSVHRTLVEYIDRQCKVVN